MDTTTSLSQWASLYRLNDDVHFTSHCRFLRETADLWFAVTVDVLDIIESGKACPECWLEADPWRPGLQPLDAIAETYRAEKALRQTAGGDPVDAVTLALRARTLIQDVHDPSVTTWRAELLQEAVETYTRNLPEATSAASRAVALAAAESVDCQVEARIGKGDETILTVDGYHLEGDETLRKVCVPYMVVAKKGSYLLQAPTKVVKVLLEGGADSANDSWLAHWGPRPFQVTAAVTPDVLLRMTEMWDPADPLFGDLDKLVEAAELIR